MRSVLSEIYKKKTFFIARIIPDWWN